MISNIINVAQFRAVTATSTVTGVIANSPLGQSGTLTAYMVSVAGTVSSTILTSASKSFEDLLGTELPANALGAELTFTTAVRLSYGSYSANDTVLPAGTYRFGTLAANGLWEKIADYSTTVTTVGADADVGVLKVEQRFVYSNVTTSTAIKSGSGFLHLVTFGQTDAAPQASTITVYNNTAASGDILYQHTFTTAIFYPVSVVIDAEFDVGLYIGYSATADINTGVSYR